MDVEQTHIYADKENRWMCVCVREGEREREWDCYSKVSHPNYEAKACFCLKNFMKLKRDEQNKRPGPKKWLSYKLQTKLMQY